MILLRESARAWGNPAFPAVLKAELEALEAARLPLQAGLAHSERVAGDGFRILVLRAWEAPARIHARVGVLYEGIVTGCSCADDPTPSQAQPEYAELELSIDRATGSARFEAAD